MLRVSRVFYCGNTRVHATPRGFEPLQAEPNGFRVHLLSHSDTVSVMCVVGHCLWPLCMGRGGVAAWGSVAVVVSETDIAPSRRAYVPMRASCPPDTDLVTGTFARADQSNRCMAIVSSYNTLRAASIVDCVVLIGVGRDHRV